MKNITIRDSGNKEVLEAYFLNHEGQPYNLENKTVTFMENKDGDKFVSDPNVQIVNETAGFVRYTLQSQVHSAPGIAWFEINDDSGLVDSTGNFNIRVENGLRATADNTTYIAALEKLKQQMEALIQQADGELKTELQKAEQQLNQELQNFRNQYNSLSADFQNQFKTAQNARQQDYNNQKNAINADWTNNKGEIWGQWNNDKANIDKQAQDTVQAIKDNAKQVLDKDQANWNAKQKQWDSTFSAIVKEWQVKTNSLNATVQDLTNKFNTIIGQVSDLMNNKIPTMNAKTDAVNKKIDQLKASLSDVDWTEYAHRSDNSGGVNLLPDTSTFRLFSTGHYGDSDAHNGISIDSKEQHSSETNINLVKTKIAHVWADKAMNAPLVIPGGTYLPAGTYTLSFLARTNGNDSSPTCHFGLYSDWTNTHGGHPLAQSDAVNNVWSRHQITFTISESYYHITLRIQQYDKAPIPGGSIYFANLKLEAGSIATDWCQSYLDFDRLDGQRDPVDAPDFNNLTSTGIYMITQPDHGKNYPAAIWGILKVDNADDNRIEQEYYEDVANGSIYHRQAVSGTWRAWQKLANIDDLSKVKIKLQSLDQNGDTFTNTQTANKQSDGSYVINTYDNDWTANKVSWLLKNTNSYVIGRNTNLNDIKAPGLYHCSGASNIVNVPGGEDNWFNMIVNSDNWNGSQALYATNSNQLYIRTWNNSGFKQWHRIINDGDYNNLSTSKADKSNTYTKTEVDNKLSAKANASDLANRSITSITDYDVGAEKWHNTQTSKFNSSGNFANYLVDAGALKPIAHTINSLSNDNNSLRQNISDLSDRLSGFMMTQSAFQRRVDYSNPAGNISDTTVNLNDYRETGILKLTNCHIQNGPYQTDNPHWIFVKITAFDGNTAFQTIDEGDNMYKRKFSSGGWSKWFKYENQAI